ncbi:MAG: YggS family pyridoxal phosphate-dependent enzyme [Polyangiaceae bacterium]|nr:YggS family pyridoxal phosphate-dependent enzyme [Polyangiaceae bacterium]
MNRYAHYHQATAPSLRRDLTLDRVGVWQGAAPALHRAMRALTPEDIARFGEDPTARFKANLDAVEARISAACRRAGRPRAEVRLLPITKTVPVPVLERAILAGVTTLGENRVQELEQKHAALHAPGLRWCLVGHLQGNKVKQAVRIADEFHALDSLRLAARLDAALEALGRELDVTIQVNTSGEQTKFGIAPSEVMAFADALGAYPRLRPRGLMTLAMLSADLAEVRPCFERLRALRDQVIRQHPSLTELSMGMSGDFEAAIEEGATIVRVGQALFGARPTRDSDYWPGLAP